MSMSLRKPSAALALALLVLAPAVRAQDNCQPLSGVTTAAWDPATRSLLGPVYIKIGSEIFSGKYLPPEQPSVEVCDSLFCQETGGKFRFDFSNGDTLLVDVKSAIYPHAESFSSFHAIATVAGGTGRFVNATGFLFEKGNFLGWTDSRDNQYRSQYRGEIGGSLCALAPAK